MPQTGKTETLITEPGITEVQPMPVVNANAPTQSMQNLSTIWQEHKVKSGESLSAIFSSNDLNKLDLHNINVSVFPVCAIFVVISGMVKAIVSGADGSDFSAKKA
jgi:hypothetical protein